MSRPSTVAPVLGRKRMAVIREPFLVSPTLGRASLRPMSMRVLLESFMFLNSVPCGVHKSIPCLLVFSIVLFSTVMFSSSGRS